LDIVAYLVLEVVFIIVVLICIPTEDGWERASTVPTAPDQKPALHFPPWTWEIKELNAPWSTALVAKSSL